MASVNAFTARSKTGFTPLLSLKKYIGASQNYKLTWTDGWITTITSGHTAANTASGKHQCRPFRKASPLPKQNCSNYWPKTNFCQILLSKATRKKTRNWKYDSLKKINYIHKTYYTTPKKPTTVRSNRGYYT